MKRSYPTHCLFRLNVGGVEMMPSMYYITNIMSILGHIILDENYGEN